MYQNRQSITRSISGAIILLGLVLIFSFGHFSLPIFFVALAFATFIGALGRPNLRSIYGSMVGFFWMLILALFFLTHSWLWFLVGAIMSVVLGSLIRPILAVLLGIGLFRVLTNRQSQPPYPPPQQPYPPYQPPPYQPYQQGYQPPEMYQEGEDHYYYPSYSSESEMPQAQYPQEMPPPE